MTSKAGKKERENAYSIIELFVVFAIIVVMAALSMPHFALYGPQKRLETAAREFVTAIRTTRGYAVTQNTNYDFEFYDIAGGKYRIMDQAATLEETYSLPDGITCTAPVQVSLTITFSPSGAVSGANPPTITFQNTQGSSKNITIVNTTGKAEIS